MCITENQASKNQCPFCRQKLSSVYGDGVVPTAPPTPTVTPCPSVVAVEVQPVKQAVSSTTTTTAATVPKLLQVPAREEEPVAFPVKWTPTIPAANERTTITTMDKHVDQDQDEDGDVKMGIAPPPVHNHITYNYWTSYSPQFVTNNNYFIYNPHTNSFNNANTTTTTTNSSADDYRQLLTYGQQQQLEQPQACVPPMLPAPTSLPLLEAPAPEQQESSAMVPYVRRREEYVDDEVDYTRSLVHRNKRTRV
jgi:hypothetical protein